MSRLIHLTYFSENFKTFTKLKKKMQVCGKNQYFGLGEESNREGYYGQCISPPFDSHVVIPSLKSFSAFDNHAVWVTREGQGFAIGSNESGQILGTMSKEVHQTEQLINIIDEKGQRCKIISAVCGHEYTLYLVSSETYANNQLVYSNENDFLSSPLFLSINGPNPLYLFGGWKTAAVIDNEGSIYVITKSVLKSIEKVVEKSVLPDDEKAVSVACCNTFVVAVSSNGRTFWSSLESAESGGSNRLIFRPVDELEKVDIVQVSGTMQNCLAVSRDGRVFGFGSNEWGQIGLGRRKTIASKFTQILALQSYRIVSASAGCCHSLFVSSDGTVLACGINGYGQLMLETGPSKRYVYLPVETSVTSFSSFIIAGNDISIVFVDCEAPKNSPNRVIPKEIAETDVATNKRWIQMQAEENARLKDENAKKTEKITKLEEENIIEKAKVFRLMKENDAQKEIIQQLEEENVAQIDTIIRLRTENSIEREKSSNLKNENEIQSNQIYHLKEENRIQSNKLFHLDSQVSSQKVELVKLKEDNQLKEKNILQLKNENLTQKTEIDKLRIENSVKEKRINKLVDKNEGQKLTIDHLKGKDINKLKETVAQAKIEINKLKSKNSQEKKEISQYKKENLSQKSKITQLITDISCRDAKISHLKEENSAHKTEAAQVKDDH